MRRSATGSAPCTSARRAGTYEARIVEVITEHFVCFAEQAERLVLLVEQVVDIDEHARAICERILGA